MTEKRFEIYDEENGYVRDNKTGNSYSACGGGDGFPFVIDEYHKLQKENEQLNLINNYRGEMVSFATSLIQDMGSEEMLKMWNDFTEGMYQKWKKRD